MIRAYCQSAATLNLLRAFATGGYAAMQRVTQWNLDFTEHSEQGDSQILTVTGDIVFVLQQKEHPKFKRKGEDIFVEHSLSLTEALCGFQFILSHLDGRQLLIKSDPGGSSEAQFLQDDQ